MLAMREVAVSSYRSLRLSGTFADADADRSRLWPCGEAGPALS
jgi:hypothetical protein